MERKRIFVSILTALFLLGQADCSRGENTRNFLRYQLGAEPVSLDPAFAEDGVSLQVLSNTMMGLFGYDGAGNLKQRLASDYSVSSDGKHYAFTLRHDAKWSDGKAVELSEFVAAFRRTLAPQSLSKLSTLLLPIKGAKDYHFGTGPAVRLAVREESGKLVIDLEQPVSYFLQLLTMSMTFPVREDLLKKSHGKWLDSFPTTGSYFIKKHVIDEKIVLAANPFSILPPAIQVVEMWIVPDETTGANLFEENKLDILSRVPNLEMDRFSKNGWLKRAPFFATYYLAFNVNKAPFNSLLNRRAVAASINKEEIVHALDSGDRVAESFVPFGVEGYFREPILKPLSQKELEEARSNLSPLPAVPVDFDSSSRNSMILEKVQNDLMTHLGLKISLDNTDWKTFIKKVQTDASPMYRFGLLAPFNDPIVHLQFFMSHNPNNYTHWMNSSYDKQVEEIAVTPPSPDRDRKLKQAQDILENKAAVVIPVYHYVQNQAVSKRVKNYRVNPFGEVLFNELTLADDSR